MKSYRKKRIFIFLDFFQRECVPRMTSAMARKGFAGERIALYAHAIATSETNKKNKREKRKVRREWRERNPLVNMRYLQNQSLRIQEQEILLSLFQFPEIHINAMESVCERKRRERVSIPSQEHYIRSDRHECMCEEERVTRAWRC